ncbi:hypothetical protein TNIN_450131 [Trichonephila inaurata madagascariensis]|uniref:Uncharacterized protein n=1 Tax=Trichonephila inaurata madagascariensis TaxID=2747483 RepID=A0A8X6XQB6_9ARAC|nr:hypothetical protein TNIN_450131 [Trichonephila inaurata madagascariensis]
MVAQRLCFDKAPQKEVIGRMSGDLGGHFNNALSSRYSSVVGDVHLDTFSRHYGIEEASSDRRRFFSTELENLIYSDLLFPKDDNGTRETTKEHIQ